jgi:DNA invertase Pin-like site-specific DNA recombinase
MIDFVVPPTKKIDEPINIDYRAVKNREKIETVAIYTRISPNPKKADTESQERDLRQYALNKGWRIVEEYSDIGISGKNSSDRPAFRRMLEDARKHKFDLVLFWALDRFSREGVYETMDYLRRLNSWGVDYKSYTEEFFDSCGIFKEAVIAIMSALAKQERVRRVERINAGLTTARLRGIKLGRPRAVIDIVVAKEMKQSGATLKEIATKFGVSESKICRALQQVNKS